MWDEDIHLPDSCSRLALQAAVVSQSTWVHRSHYTSLHVQGSCLFVHKQKGPIAARKGHPILIVGCLLSAVLRSLVIGQLSLLFVFIFLRDLSFRTDSLRIFRFRGKSCSLKNKPKSCSPKSAPRNEMFHQIFNRIAPPIFGVSLRTANATENWPLKKSARKVIIAQSKFRAGNLSMCPFEKQELS